MTAAEEMIQTLIPVSQASQIFGRAAVGAGVAGLLLLLALHVVRPDLAPSWRMVSEYAIGRHSWLMTTCSVMLAICCIALAIALFPQATSPLGRVGLVFLLATSCGYGLAALFPTDPITVLPQDASSAARLHAMAFAIGVPSFILASQLTSFALADNSHWDGVRIAMFGSANLNWIGLAVMVGIIAVTLPRAGGFGPDVLVGWPNRLMFVTYFGWIMATAWPQPVPHRACRNVAKRTSRRRPSSRPLTARQIAQG